MKRLILKLAVALLAFAVGVATFFVWDGFRQLPETIKTNLNGSSRSDALSLRLSASNTLVRLGEEPKIGITITNDGDETATLVQPGDGSESGWRTPVIGWSIVDARENVPIPNEWERGCGNINALKSEEVFRLSPGESEELRDWVSLPPFRKPGVYRVSFSYSNQPSLEWSGEPLGYHDPVAMWRIKNSTECSLVSNEVVFTVSE